MPPPEPIVTTERVSYLKFLGVTFQDSPTNWDKHFDDLMERAVKRMHILRVCKRNGYSVSDLEYLFNCLIMSLFNYCIRVWGVAAYTKYLSQIDRLVRRAFRFGYIQHESANTGYQRQGCETLEKYYGCFLASPEGSSPPT